MTHCLTTVIDCTGVVPSARDPIGTEVTQVSRNLNRGEAVGHATSDASTVAFLWSRDKGMKGLGTLPGDFASFAIGINDEGQVVGQSIGANFSSVRAFLWVNGVMTDLNTLVAVNPGKLSLLVAESINDRKEIIGLAVDGAGNFHGYMAIP